MTYNIKGRIIVKKSKIESIDRFHPWIFSGAIKTVEGNPAEGDLVEVYDHHDRFLAIGHYGNQSIAVRILSFSPIKDLGDLFQNRIKSAYDFRCRLGFPSHQTNAFRLIFAEADLLPGLIIDYYNGLVMIEYHSRGMVNHENEILQALLSLRHDLPIYTVLAYEKNTQPSSKKCIWGKEPFEELYFFLENGLTFLLPWKEGQKTGFFLDQRENRSLLKQISQNKNVLNMFSYTGSFSIYALKGNALSVTSVDSSQKAIEVYQETLKVNGFSQQPAFVEDAFDFLESLEPNMFDIIVLDPPAFAKHIQHRHHALLGYRRINELAIRKIKKGGHIFTFSCSQAVSMTQFIGAITSAAIHEGRHIRVVSYLNQSHCHAYSVFHPEGSYLKGLWLYVE
ncbi:MAG: class I SAM-dependent rRNA methyltransferase [Bacteroidales bacterium]|nr:class I SAM-dependent rRNA methyltransferase [Bacteroidales bacterium]